jgi:hypothetical protein
MGRKMMQLGTTLLVGLMGARSVAAQKPYTLAKPDAEFAEAFSQVAGIRELGNGRVLVSDAREKVIKLVDFKGGAVTVGREGGGPGEYAIPTRIVALPGDTSAIYDAGNGRYLIVDPDGNPSDDFRLDTAGGSGQLGLIVRTSPHGVDSRGNIYVQGSPFHVDVQGVLTPSDSAPIIRFGRTTLRADTVAFTRLAKGNGSVTGRAGGGVELRNGLANPLVPVDDWVALPDGRVVVIRADDYHADLYHSPAASKSGPRIAYEKIKVDDAVKRMVEEQRVQLRRNAPNRVPGRGGAPARGLPTPTRPVFGDWPAFMPPFLAQAAVARPNGQVWVLRTQRPGNDAPLYDVLDDTGRLIGRVVLPHETRLVGFGQGTVYLVRIDDDDLEHLQRYRLRSDAALKG